MAALRVRSELGGGASLETLRTLLGVARPVGARRLVELYSADVVLEEPLVTSEGVALGGGQRITLGKDGSWQWTGHFRATGWPSYKVALASRVIASDGTTLALSVHGETHGTAEPGDREFSWTQAGRNALIPAGWAGFRRATLQHELQHDADFFGTVGDVLAFVSKSVLAGAAAGSAGLWLVLSAEAIDALDLQRLSLPGLVGLVVAGGTVLVLGPFGGVIAIVAGIAAGIAVQDALKVRTLKKHEYDAFNEIFGNTLPKQDKIVLTNLLGQGGRAFVWPGPGETIWVNVGEGIDNPLSYRGKGGPELDTDGTPFKAPGQLLVHELTHAWQIGHSDLIPVWMCQGFYNQLGTLGGDMSTYSYDVPHKPWPDYNAEQQASIVDGWYAGSLSPKAGKQSSYPPRDDRLDHNPAANPYYRFIRDHIRAGVA